MINLRTQREIVKLQDAAKISAQALLVAGELCKPGVTTWEIDKAVEKFIVSQKAEPSFLNYQGFPASSCISVNDTVIHGIPSKDIVLKSGDIVSVDVGAFYNGYHGDNAYTFKVGEVSEELEKLLETTQNSLYSGISQAIVGKRIGDISSAVEKTVEVCGYGVVREFVGHGVGKNLHEDPEVPNFGMAGKGPRLAAGMVIAIEPMITMGDRNVYMMPDRWTIRTRDGKPAAHFEHTIVVRRGEAEILSSFDELESIVGKIS